MTDDLAVQLALKLMKLGVSRIGVMDLLGHYPYDLIERQLTYLPFRKAKRPEALIIDAIRNDYSPPKEFYYASHETANPARPQVVDQNPEPRARPTDADLEGHGASDSPSAPSPNRWLESGGAGYLLVVPPIETSDGEAE